MERRGFGGFGGWRRAAGTAAADATAATATTTTTTSFQYSFNARESPVYADFAGNVHALPGVFFVWDVSPFMVQMAERPHPVGHFIARL